MVSVHAEFQDPEWLCQVEVTDDGVTTQHEVRLKKSDLDRWGRDGTPEDLVRRSFDFLLEREPARSIMRSFQLSEVLRYFPEFDRAMSS